MNRSLAPWRPARMSGRPIMGVQPLTCYMLSGVGAAVTSSLAIELMKSRDPSPYVPGFIIGWAPWLILGAVIGIAYERPGAMYGIWLGSLGGSVVAVVTNLILG